MNKLNFIDSSNLDNSILSDIIYVDFEKIKKHRLYIIDSPDGTGKTTLSQEILSQCKGHLLHCTWKKDFNIKEYFKEVFISLSILLQYQDVTLDRFAVSDEVYANAYRGGATFNADEFMTDCFDSLSIPIDNIRFIYCENDKAIENHKENVKIRDEMFDDISPVIKEYEKYLSKTKFNWIHYNWTKCNMKQFVEELIKKEE